MLKKCVICFCIVLFIACACISFSANVFALSPKTKSPGPKKHPVIGDVSTTDPVAIYSHYDAIHKKAAYFYDTSHNTINLAIGTSELVRTEVTTYINDDDWNMIWHGCSFDLDEAKKGEFCDAMKSVIDQTYGQIPIDKMEFSIMEEMIYKVMHYKDAFEHALTNEFYNYYTGGNDLEVPFIPATPGGAPNLFGGGGSGAGSVKVCSASGLSKDFGLAGDPLFFGDLIPADIPIEMVMNPGQWSHPGIFDCPINASIIINNGGGVMADDPPMDAGADNNDSGGGRVEKVRKSIEEGANIKVTRKKVEIPLSEKLAIEVGEMDVPELPESANDSSFDSFHEVVTGKIPPKIFYGLSFKVTFTERPDEGSSSAQYFCGGPAGMSLFNDCFGDDDDSDDSDDSDDCEEGWKNKYGPVTTPVDGFTKKSICGEGNGPIDESMTDTYYTDESPIGDGPPDPGEDDACGPSFDGKPSAACCQQNPGFPGCGSGPVFQEEGSFVKEPMLF